MLWSANKLYQYRRQAPLSFLFLPCSFPVYLLSLPRWPSYFCTFPPSLVISFPKTTIVFAQCLKKAILVLVSEVPWLYMWLYYFVRLWFISRLTEILLFSQILCFNVSPPCFSPRYVFKIIPFSICFPELYFFRSVSSGLVLFSPHFLESLLYFIVLSASLVDITKRNQKITGTLGV